MKLGRSIHPLVLAKAGTQKQEYRIPAFARMSGAVARLARQDTH